MRIDRRTLLVGAGVMALARFALPGTKAAADGSAAAAALPDANAMEAEAAWSNDAAVIRIGTGGFATLAAAMASISDASATKPYRIEAEYRAEGYEMRDIVWKDNVALRGLGDMPVLFRCELAANADPLAVSYTRPVHGAMRARFDNIHVRAKNCRFPLDLTDVSTAEGIPSATGCVFEHLGNDEVQAHWAATNNGVGFVGSQQRVGTARESYSIV